MEENSVSDVVDSSAPDPYRPFVVGIGASAGGLRPMEQLFAALPPDSGIAFAVVTHISPERETLLPSLLGRWTKMPVLKIEDGMLAEPNKVYIAPDGNLSMYNGKFRLTERAKRFEHQLPIDYFFRTLAADLKSRSAGIVLSGNGSDGSLGLRSIREVGGLTLVQEPSTAEYDSMPKSALNSGAVDLVLPIREMPGYLSRYAEENRNLPAHIPRDDNYRDLLERIFLLLREETGHDFFGYKVSTLRRRIERRRSIHLLPDLKSYLRFLHENRHEVDLLFKEFLINVTSFFRDPQMFEALAGRIDQLVEQAAPKTELRAWVPACSSGEEAYSIAILFVEALKKAKREKEITVQIFGSDLDSEAIKVARVGRYPDLIASSVGPERLENFFTKEDSAYKIRRELREMVIFAPHNVLSSPPFTKLNLLSCRNLMIYLEAHTQSDLLRLFHYALEPNGILFLGSSETVSAKADLFEAVDKNARLFERKSGKSELYSLSPRTAIPQAPASARKEITPANSDYSTPQSMSAIERYLLREGIAASVIVDDKGGIIHVQGRTGQFLEQNQDGAKNNILSMVRESLQPDLSILLGAIAEGSGVQQRIGQLKSESGIQFVSLRGWRIESPQNLSGLFLLQFEMIPQAEASGRSSADAVPPQLELERELQYTREHLQNAIGQLEISNEDLKSINEELQSTNEELQSANEELETAKEETQSLNEELQAVNTELQTKIEELSQASDDLSDLLNSTEIATLYLDRDLHVKRFTKRIRKLVRLIGSDVGRPIDEIATEFKEALIVPKSQRVLETLTAIQEDVQTVDGTWYQMRIGPYRNYENTIGGIVITFVEITTLKEAQAIASASELARQIVETVNQPLLVLDEKLAVVAANPMFQRIFKVSPESVAGKDFFELAGGAFDDRGLRELLQKVLPVRSVVEGFSLAVELPGLGRTKMQLNARQIERDKKAPALILVALELESS